MLITTLALAGISGLFATHNYDDACSIVRTAGDDVPKVEETRVVARVLNRTFTESYGDDHPRRRGDARGRLIRIAAGEGAATDGVAAPGSEAVVFAWALGMDCNLYSTDFEVAADSLHHFTMQIRPPSDWVAGRPTFDVDFRGWRIFPGGFPNGSDYALSGPEPSVLEYAEMISLIPDTAEWSVDCRPGMNELIAWHNAHGQPFNKVVPGLLTHCEQSVEFNARTLLQRGPEAAPPELEHWARAAECRLGRDEWSSRYKAVLGHFNPGREPQWAVLCETASEWRLVVLDPDGAEVVAELARVTGASDGWSVRLAPPEYFHWSPIEWPAGTVPRSRSPLHDAVLLGESTALFFDGQEWTGASVYCCHVIDRDQ